MEISASTSQNIAEVGAAIIGETPNHSASFVGMALKREHEYVGARPESEFVCTHIHSNAPTVRAKWMGNVDTAPS